MPYADSIKIQFDNPIGFVGALVGGNSVLLGAIPMKNIDSVIFPSERKLADHPDRTNIAGLIAKGLTNLKMCLSVSVQSDELN
jgi:hypothetical protein